MRSITGGLLLSTVVMFGCSASYVTRYGSRFYASDGEFTEDPTPPPTGFQTRVFTLVAGRCVVEAFGATTTPVETDSVTPFIQEERLQYIAPTSAPEFLEQSILIERSHVVSFRTYQWRNPLCIDIFRRVVTGVRADN